MKANGVRPLATTVTAVVLVFTAGCMFAADVFNPGLFSAFGLDPGTIFAAKGMIIVSFTNNTPSDATFFAYEARDPLDLTTGSRNFSVEVPPNSRRNEVLDCPVGVISPSSLQADFTPDGVAANVNGQDIQYAWPLIGDRDFKCGDVIDIELSGVGAGGGGTTGGTITVRVIPGR